MPQVGEGLPDRVIGAPASNGVADPFSPDGAGGASPGSSLLEDLAAELAAEVARPPVILPVPARAGWAIRVRSDVQFPELEGWRRRATTAGRVDQVTWAELVVGGATLAILKRPAPDAELEEVVEAGATVTFRSDWLQRALGATSALVAVRKLFASDAHLTAAAMEVLRASGWDDDLKPLDPTSAG